MHVIYLHTMNIIYMYKHVNVTTLLCTYQYMHVLHIHIVELIEFESCIPWNSVK